MMNRTNAIIKKGIQMEIPPVTGISTTPIDPYNIIHIYPNCGKMGDSHIEILFVDKHRVIYGFTPEQAAKESFAINSGFSLPEMIEPFQLEGTKIPIWATRFNFFEDFNFIIYKAFFNAGDKLVEAILDSDKKDATACREVMETILRSIEIVDENP